MTHDQVVGTTVLILAWIFLVGLMWRAKLSWLPGNRLGCYALALPFIVATATSLVRILLQLPRTESSAGLLSSLTATLFWFPIVWYYIRYSRDSRFLRCSVLIIGLMAVTGLWTGFFPDVNGQPSTTNQQL